MQLMQLMQLMPHSIVLLLLWFCSRPVTVSGCEGLWWNSARASSRAHAQSQMHLCAKEAAVVPRAAQRSAWAEQAQLVHLMELVRLLLLLLWLCSWSVRMHRLCWSSPAQMEVRSVVDP